ncbi:MAG: hypothetical protein ACKVZJ_02440 [Phycisphaerales bacterium]
MGKCMWISAIAGGVLAMTSVSTAESNIVNDQAGSVTAAGIKIVKEIGRASADPRLKHLGVAKMPPAPDDGYGNAAFLSAIGPVATDSELGVDSTVSDLVTCGVCTAGATTAQETALPTLWTTWGDAFFNTAPAVAGRWLQDQGCFIITACAGNINPANRFAMPVSFNYTANLVPAGRVCGFISNFDAPNDAANGAGISLFDVPDAGAPTPTRLPTNPVGCATLDATPPALTTNQRDQDALEFVVGPNGIEDFRIFVTAANEFDAIFYVNKNFPEPGDHNSCWTDPADTNTPPQEHGWIGNSAGGLSATNPNTPAASKGPEGAPNTTWAWPRNGSIFLPQGTYFVFVRPKTFANLTPPSVPLPPNTQYMVQTSGRNGTGTPTGACCLIATGACQNNTLSFNCEKVAGAGALNGVYRGDGTTCATINAGTVPCNIAPFTANEGATRDGCTPASQAGDQNQGCVGTAPPFTLFADALSSGQIIQGFSGAGLGTNFNTFTVDDDWYTFETVAQQNVKFTLDAEFPAQFQIFFADAASLDPCAEGVGYGFALTDATRDTVLEACVPAGTLVLTRVTPTSVPYNCGSPSGPTYTLELTTGACNSVACCTLAGVCNNSIGPACFAAGGISLGEGTLCATSTCCSGTLTCTGSTTTENALPRTAGTATTDACVNASTIDTADNFNGGCQDGNTLNPFSVMNPGQKVCSTTSGFALRGDTDWYQLTVPAGVDSYAGVAIRSQVAISASLFTRPTGVICPPTAAELGDRAVASAAVTPCDTDLVILGDCLTQGSVLYVSVDLGLLEYDVPCTGGTTPAAQYYIEYITGPCTGSAVTCSGTNENETLCQFSAVNPGCNADTPVFSAIACNQTVCGTGDLIGGIRDLDWYQIAHPGGNLQIAFTSAFYGQVSVLRPGNQGPAGCDNLTVVDGRTFVRPNIAANFTVNALAAGTYWLVVGPDFDGTKRVCCAASSNYSLRPVCTPPSCKGDLTNDGLRNTADLTAFLGVFGGTSPPAPSNADFNNDGFVNTIDLTGFLGVFGVPCP